MSQGGVEEKLDRRDFFISYTGRDRQWAEWIAWQLEEAGYTLFIQAWDFRPGSNFVAEMDKATKSAERTLLVLSPTYLQSDYAFAEWAAAFRHDPRGTYRSLLPVRIELCEVEGLLGPVGYIDLVSLEEEKAREKLLGGIQRGRAKPTKVAFPRHAVAHESPIHVAFPGSEPMLWNVPYLRNPHFTGRDVLLDWLAQQLAPEAQEQKTTARRAALTQAQAIKGLGGIGKTQIAVEYAYRSRDLGQYTHIFWVNASEETLLTSFASLADLLPAFSVKEEADQHKQVEAVKRWLEQCKQQWLLIFDNADSLSLLTNYFPQQGKGSILLTTRSHAVGSLAVSITVEEMDPWEGTLFLLRRAQLFAHTSILDASDEEIEMVNEAKRIVDALDSFPLALDQAGAYIEETKCNLVDYLQIYQDHRKDLLVRRGYQITNYPESVATTWSLSFQKVEQASPAAAELLRLCAFLAPDKIPEELIKEGTIYWSSLLQQAASNPFSFNQMLEELLKFSLVKRLAEDHMLSIHRLVQAVQIDMMEPEVQQQWAERIVRAVNVIFPHDIHDTALWPRCLRYLPQAQVCNTLIEQYALLLPESIHLLSDASLYLQEHGLYTVAEQLLQHALDINNQILGSEHPETADILTNLGLLYDHQGRYIEAEQFYVQALALLRTEQSKKVELLNNLGLLYDHQGRYAEAEPLLQQALTIKEQQLGSIHYSVATGLNNLALVYEHQGKYAEAEPLYLRALEIRERVLGSDHPETAISLDNLGLFYDLQGKLADAEPLFQRALEIRERVLGSDHPNTAQSLNSMGLLNSRKGRYVEAESLYRRALAIREQSLGSNHPEVAISLNNLASTCREQGRYAEAESLFQRALAIREQQFGPTHSTTSNTLYSLALLYYRQGKYAEAEPLFQRALAIREQRLGLTHPTTKTIRKNYVLLLRALGREAEASQLEEGS